MLTIVNDSDFSKPLQLKKWTGNEGGGSLAISDRVWQHITIYDIVNFFQKKMLLSSCDGPNRLQGG